MTANRDKGLSRGGVYIDPKTRDVFNFTVLITKEGGMAIILPKHVLRVDVLQQKWTLIGSDGKLNEGDLPPDLTSLSAPFPAVDDRQLK